MSHVTKGFSLQAAYQNIVSGDTGARHRLSSRVANCDCIISFIFTPFLEANESLVLQYELRNGLRNRMQSDIMRSKVSNQKNGKAR